MTAQQKFTLWMVGMLLMFLCCMVLMFTTP